MLWTLFEVTDSNKNQKLFGECLRSWTTEMTAVHRFFSRKQKIFMVTRAANLEKPFEF